MAVDKTNQSPIIVALDFADKETCFALVEQLDPKLCRLKVGIEMFTRFGPSLIEQLHNKGYEIFLDLKFHDIPNQVAGACASAAALGVWMLNVHALGGRRMLEAAAGAIANMNGKKPLLIGVTVLTSHAASEIAEIGLASSPEECVINLAHLCQEAGLDGVVCSAMEAKVLKERINDDFCLVTPGIRLPSNQTDDQRRIVTPQDALHYGSNYLVIGRPITQSPTPAITLQQIVNSLSLNIK